MNVDLKGDLWGIWYWSRWNCSIDLPPNVVFWNSIIFKLKNYRYFKFDLEGDLWGIQYWSQWNYNIDLPPYVVFWNSIIFKLRNNRYFMFDLELCPWRWPLMSSILVSFKSQHWFTPKCRLLEFTQIQFQELYLILSLTLNFDIEGDLKGHRYRSHWSLNINLSPDVDYWNSIFKFRNYFTDDMVF